MSELEQKIAKFRDGFLKTYSFSQPNGKMDFSPAEIAASIEHTNLKPTATSSDIANLCKEAAHFHFRSVCVNPSFVSLARSNLEGKAVKVVTVVGFPLGASCTMCKANEAEICIQMGADEVDMVLHQGKLKAGDLDSMFYDIHKVVVCSGKTPVKVILETCNLSTEEIITACLLSKEAGASFVKTSTGFSTHGATLEDVHLMRAVVGKEMGVKASGGIRDWEDAVHMLQYGADLLGTSSGVNIITRSSGGKGAY
ncbi:MAG TPA: deoxyribose-phosphate aldolase [Thermotogota bacterium]|nr:deoxyribose-phosphate aldolase [Thermotogota bacterium]HRW92470.1 deoxyribose-phosphate aldolase [Thermotogota bacterium]